MQHIESIVLAIHCDLVKLWSTQGTNANYMQPRDFHEKMPGTAEFRLRPQRGVHYNHVTFTPMAKNFML